MRRENKSQKNVFKTKYTTFNFTLYPGTDSTKHFKNRSLVITTALNFYYRTALKPLKAKRYYRNE